MPTDNTVQPKLDDANAPSHGVERLRFPRLGAAPRRAMKWVAATALVVASTVVVLGVRQPMPSAMDRTASDRFWQTLAWRAHVFASKAGGGVPELSWSELWQMARVRGGFGLAALVSGGVSLEGSVHNPHTGDKDVRAGAELFRERCSVCHGNDGAGWHAPALNRPGLKHGDSDLALYATIRDGISNSAMKPAGLGFLQRWQVVGYIKSLQMRASAPGQASANRSAIRVTDARVRAAGTGTDEWLTYSGSLDGHRYSRLAQVTPANAHNLRLVWTHQFDVSESKFEATPIVADGVMFITAPPATVVALNARTGTVLWTFSRNVPADVPLCCGRHNRGVAILDDKVIFGSLDGHLIALDAATGRVAWDTKVADTNDGFSMTGAPLIVDRMVVTGVAGGEFATRGFVAAYDANTGKLGWKFNTIPGPGEFGHESWKNDAWKTGGGSTWNTGSYDPALGLVYWGIGNPAPEFSGDVRPGDNLFTNSVVALNASTGKLAWHFQFTPHDEHDWDSTQTPILTDLPIKGIVRKVICWANRNGFYYVLDRTTGEFLLGTPFVEQNWTKGLDSAGRPIADTALDVLGSGRLTKPGLAGGTNWQNPAFDYDRQLVFVHATEGASVFTKSPNPKRGEKGIYLGSSGSLMKPVNRVVRALDATTGNRRWERIAPQREDFYLSYSGLLATAGGLVIGAARGSAFALDSDTGREVWNVFLGGETLAAPVSFAIDGRQVVALLAGRSLFVFGL